MGLNPVANKIASDKYRRSAKGIVKEKLQNAKWWRENKEYKLFTDTLRRYDITLDQYHAMAERQDFSCAICRSEEKLVIDHCHSSGKVRGLLCSSCNKMLGNAKDLCTTLVMGVKYLETCRANV